MKEQIENLKMLIADYEAQGDELTVELLRMDLTELELKSLDEV